MGLDMYLYNSDSPSQEEEPLIVWRKANQVHNWFIQEVCEGNEEFNCKYAKVTRDQLIELRDTCQLILENRDKAPILLPSISGFFFGSTEYDEWYFHDLKHTVVKITEVLFKYDNDHFYYTCWW